MAEIRSPNRIEERWKPMPSGVNPKHYTPAPVPTVDTVVQLLISLANTSILAVLLTRRVVAVKHWTRLQPLNWLVMFIYADSLLFVVLSAVVSLGIGANISLGVCLFADFLCLAAYLSTKGIYYFLVEKVFLIRAVRKPRLKDPVYVFHAFGLVVFYFILTILEFVYRIGFIDKNGQCYNGIQPDTLIPLLIFDTLCNIYLMIMFVVPLRQLMSYSNPNSLSRQIAMRTLIGTCVTLICTMANILNIIIVAGERSWLCLITCNLDIFFSVLVIQWITAKDAPDSGASEASKNKDTDNGESRNARSQIRPEKPVMMPVKKKRVSTDYSDDLELDDMDEDVHHEETRKDIGATRVDGSMDHERLGGEGSMSGAGLVIENRDTLSRLPRPQSLRQKESTDLISMSSADSNAKIMKMAAGKGGL